MKRTWDESTSPQWRYLLSKESEQRKTIKWTQENHQGEIKRNKPGKKVRKKQQQQEENTVNNNNNIISKDKQFTKKGKEIVYSASPGPERYFIHHNKNPKQQPKPSTLNPSSTTTKE